jgi:hypothetical protein
MGEQIYDISVRGGSRPLARVTSWWLSVLCMRSSRSCLVWTQAMATTGRPTWLAISNHDGLAQERSVGDSAARELARTRVILAAGLDQA